MSFSQRTTLGRTGLKVGRLGVSSSFGAPTAAIEAAYERGCNYFTWGTFLKGRSTAMRDAIRHLTANGKREDMVVGMLTYAHSAWLTEHFFIKGLMAAGLAYVDLLLLGYFPKRPPQRIIDGAMDLKRKGLVRFIGLTSHNRRLFPELAKENFCDVFHIRYNAAHTAAESETFSQLSDDDRPGVVSFTATDWRRLLNPKRMPPGEGPLTAGDCYRFTLTHPVVDVCMMGAKNMKQMQENLAVLEQGPLTGDEMERVRRIGRYVHTSGRGTPSAAESQYNAKTR